MTSLPAGLLMDKSFTLSLSTVGNGSDQTGKGVEEGDSLIVGELTLSPDASQFDKWIEVAETTWAEDGERQLMQIGNSPFRRVVVPYPFNTLPPLSHLPTCTRSDSLAQKYAAAKSPEIVLWLQRKADRIRGSKHKSIATDEF